MAMFTSVRRHWVQHPDEVTRRVQEEFVPRIKEIPGFTGYYIVRGEDGELVSISVFETWEGAEASNRLSREWDAEHLQGLLEGEPEIITGEVVIQEMHYPEQEARKAA